MPSLARVKLRKNLARSVRGGHPWIFREALAPGAMPADGDLVLVTTGDGRALGRGFWTASTPIAVRMLTTDPRDDIARLVPARLQVALTRRLAFLDLGRTNAFRWVHGEADLLPGLHLDVYAGHGSVRFDGPGARAFYRDLTPMVMAAGEPIGLHTLIERIARRRSGGKPVSVLDDVVNDGPRDSASALRGQIPKDEIEIRENGLRFGVDLGHGQKGGLFLDQRDNRERVRGLGRNRRVLNLFGYTGGFSIYAAAGGASATTTVDTAAGAIASARRNFARNGLPADDARFVVADVFAFLAEAARNRERWDLVISDPPSFAPSRRALPEALRAYRRLHRMCASVVEPAGTLCAASCSSHVESGAFVSSIQAGCADAGRRFVSQGHHGAGADHPILEIFPEGRYLKFTVGTVS